MLRNYTFFAVRAVEHVFERNGKRNFYSHPNEGLDHWGCFQTDQSMCCQYTGVVRVSLSLVVLNKCDKGDNIG